MNFETTFLSIIRLTPDWLNCDAATFIARAYRNCLSRECEFDEAGRTAMMPAGDRYEARARYFCIILGSPEGLERGHAAMVDAVATLLGGRQREAVAAIVRARYPSAGSLAAALETLMAHARDNSRRQDAILALAAAAPDRFERLAFSAH